MESVFLGVLLASWLVIRATEIYELRKARRERYSLQDALDREGRRRRELEMRIALRLDRLEAEKREGPYR